MEKPEYLITLIGGLTLFTTQLVHLMRTIRFEHTVNSKMDMLLALREKKGFDEGQRAAQAEQSRREKIEEKKDHS